MLPHGVAEQGLRILIPGTGGLFSAPARSVTNQASSPRDGDASDRTQFAGMRENGLLSTNRPRRRTGVYHLEVVKSTEWKFLVGTKFRVGLELNL